ncbi:hypothetical protein HDV04_001190, partial [Boothiomyces sp. JEL0838]
LQFECITVSPRIFNNLSHRLPNAKEICMNVEEGTREDELDRVFDYRNLNRVSVGSSVDHSISKAVITNLSGVRLSELSLYNCGLDDQDIINLIHTMPFDTLRILELANNKISNKGAIAISTILPQSRLKKINLYFNQIQMEGFKHLCQALPKCKLQELQIQHNPIDTSDYYLLGDNLPGSNITNCYLKIIDKTTANSFSQNIKQSRVKTLIIDIEKEFLDQFLLGLYSSTVESLTVREDLKFEDACATILGSHLNNLPVKSITVLNCAFSDISLIFSSITKETPLCNLELNGGSFTGDVHPSLINSNLKYLKISSYNSDQALLRSIFRSLSECNLEKLEIYSTNLSSLSSDITDGIVGSKLTSLSLVNTRLTDGFLDHLSKTISQSRTKYLVLDYNQFTREGMDRFVNAARNSKVKEISFQFILMDKFDLCIKLT